MRNKRIIIVEDDRAVQDLFSIILDNPDYKIDVFSDSLPIEKGQFDIPDLFIIDRLLAYGVDGLDLCKKLKSDPRTKTVPVIMISASPGIVKMAKDAGADGALDKPFRIKAIRDCVNRHLNRSSFSKLSD